MEMADNRLDFYEKKRSHFENELNQFQKRFNLLATLRLGFTIFSLVAFLWLINEEYWQILWGYGLVFFLAFFSLVSRHLKLKKRIDKTKCLIIVNKQEIQAVQGDFSSFDEGRAFLPPNHNHAFDLDFFTKKGLFPRIDRTSTSEGTAHLVHLICGNTSQDIQEKQTIYKELAEKVDWRQEFAASGLIQKSEKRPEKDQLMKWMNEKSHFSQRKILSLVTIVLPLLTILSLVLSAFSIIPMIVSLGFLGFNFGLTGLYLSKINIIHGVLSRKHQSLSMYAQLLDIFSQTSFSHNTLGELQVEAKGASDTIKGLENYMNRLDARLNMFMAVFLNSVLLWDLRQCLKIDQWRLKHQNELPEWIKITATIDAYNSMGNYVFNHPEFSWPTMSERQLILAKEMAHPFLAKEVRINNNFELNRKGQVILLTGANMSGKSTFLRTVGLNLAMANMGLPVCAGSFEFYPMPVLTSMRIDDSLADGESYFYAELKRLKQLIEVIESGEEVFLLIDEMLRGTNSNDKHKGSVGLIHKLIKLNTSAILASHDVSLSELKKTYPDHLINSCFEVENVQGELQFDYTLRDGVCQNLNASYLLQKMGVI